MAAIHAVLGYALISGLGIDVPRGIEETLKVFDVPVAPPPPPPPIETPPPKPRSAAAKNAAAPPNLMATPSPVVAPRPVVRLETPTVVAAPLANVGSDPDAGTSDGPGTGTGAGGEGGGTGGGGLGDGYGAGGSGDGGEIIARARRIGGRISKSDLPRALKRAGAQGTVLTRYSVGPDGRVADCEVTRSSGDAELDAHTCRLVRSRFRYRPARDAAGRPVTDVLFGEHHWWAGR